MEDVHDGAALFTIFVARPVGRLAFLAGAGHRLATFPAKGLILAVVGLALGADTPFQDEFAVTGVAGDMTAVFAHIYRVQTVGTGNFG